MTKTNEQWTLEQIKTAAEITDQVAKRKAAVERTIKRMAAELKRKAGRK